MGRHTHVAVRGQRCDNADECVNNQVKSDDFDAVTNDYDDDEDVDSCFVGVIKMCFSVSASSFIHSVMVGQCLALVSDRLRKSWINP